MAMALEDALGRALGREVAAWVEKTAGGVLEARRALVASAEKSPEGAEARADVAIVSDQVDIISIPRASIPRATVADAPPRTPRATTPPPLPSSRTSRAADIDIRVAMQSVTSEMPTTMRRGDPDMERTATSFVDGTAPSAPAPFRSRTDRFLYGTLAVAVALVIVVAASWSKIRPEPTPAFSETPTAAAVTAPAVTATTPASAPTPEAVVAAIPVPTPFAAPATPQAPAAGRRPFVRSAHAAASSPSKVACVSKLDPSTGKKIYQGDCD
jgi:hypothetical protein